MAKSLKPGRGAPRQQDGGDPEKVPDAVYRQVTQESEWRAFARAELRRELAVFVAAIRSRLEQSVVSLHEVQDAVRDKGSLLHGLCDPGHLDEVAGHLEDALRYLVELFVPDVEPRDILRRARDFAEHQPR